MIQNVNVGMINLHVSSVTYYPDAIDLAGYDSSCLALFTYLEMTLLLEREHFYRPLHLNMLHLHMFKALYKLALFI